MGQRLDGRGAQDLRPFNFETGYINTAPGAVLMEMGQTRVICTASIEAKVPGFLADTGQGWLTAEYSMLPGSSPRRVAREVSGKPNSRSREIQRLIGRSLRAAIDLKALGERTIYIDCDVIQADGGTRTASITGGYVALGLAIQKLRKSGELEQDPLGDPVAAISVGVVDDNVLLDLCYEEDVRAGTDMNIVMAAGGGLIEMQGTAEGAPFSRKQVGLMLDVAEKGINELIVAQKKALETV
jgi:ribonuclease PH